MLSVQVGGVALEHLHLQERTLCAFEVNGSPKIWPLKESREKTLRVFSGDTAVAQKSHICGRTVLTHKGGKLSPIIFGIFYGPALRFPSETRLGPLVKQGPL